MSWQAPALIGAALAVIAAGAVPVASASVERSARSDYIEHCAGCHGMSGSAEPAKVPTLEGRVGYFLCTKRGRDYLVRLPNVARAPVDDDQALADLLNYVVFEVGGDSAPRGADRFAADEVHDLRKQSYVKESLTGERRQIVSELLRRCPATPRSLGRFH